jgi:hypothetical protein
MDFLNLTMVTNVVLAGVVLSIVMGLGGMVLWYIKIKPQMEIIHGNLEKKAESEELSRIALDLERKREDSQRIQSAIISKQDISNCDLLRKGCQPLLLEQMNGLTDKVNDLRENQKILFAKLDTWMLKNGKIKLQSKNRK